MSQNVSTTTRHTISEKMVKDVQSQFTGLANTDMTAFTLERTKSETPVQTIAMVQA